MNERRPSMNSASLLCASLTALFAISCAQQKSGATAAIDAGHPPVAEMTPAQATPTQTEKAPQLLEQPTRIDEATTQPPIDPEKPAASPTPIAQAPTPIAQAPTHVAQLPKPTPQDRAQRSEAPTPPPKPETPVPAALISDEIHKKITDAGVPAASLNRILNYLEKNKDKEITQDTYTCKLKSARDKQTDVMGIKPCDESLRIPAKRDIKIVVPRYVAVLNFNLPSTVERLFVIDLQTGSVDKHLATHGKGSGNSKWAYKFSNRKDSEMSSLGLFQFGELYHGGKGAAMRLYGLESSNDQAFNRDIVAHGAWYAEEDFFKRIDPRTGENYTRLGLSWGCPAVGLKTQALNIPRLKDGGIIDLYQSELMVQSLSGGTVSITPPDEN